MRKPSLSSVFRIGAAGWLLIAAPADAQPPPPPGGQPQAYDARGLVLMPHTVPTSDKEIVGLAESWAAETLTWDRIYPMALVRARVGAKAAEALDPKALAEEARRLEVADFARFRKEFLDGGAFRDPGGAYLAILRRLQAIDDARRHNAALQNLLNLLQELIQGESSGMGQSDVDFVAQALARGQQEMSTEVARLRDGLDELKVVLGLSPHAAVVPDRREIAAFGKVFTETDRWSRRPDRNLAELPRIVEQLPAVGDVTVGGQPILVAVEKAPARLEDVLRDAGRLAIKDRAAKGSDAELELRVRRRVRHLLEIRRDYEDAKRVYVLAVRLMDQTFERLFGSRIGNRVPMRWPAIPGLVADLDRCRGAEDRLVTLWTAFRTERLALYRDLGTLPYDNWQAFLDDLRTEPDIPAKADRNR